MKNGNIEESPFYILPEYSKQDRYYKRNREKINKKRREKYFEDKKWKEHLKAGRSQLAQGNTGLIK